MAGIREGKHKVACERQVLEERLEESRKRLEMLERQVLGSLGRGQGQGGWKLEVTAGEVEVVPQAPEEYLATVN